MSRPPQPDSKSLAASQVARRSAGASPLLVATAIPGGINLLELAKAQQSCAEVALLRTNSSLLLEDVPVGHLTICCDTSGARRQPLIHLLWQRRVFDTIHSLAHPGIRATRRLLAARLVWKGMAADVSQWVQRVHALPESKDNNSTSSSHPTSSSTWLPVHPLACRPDRPPDGQC